MKWCKSGYNERLIPTFPHRGTNPLWYTEKIEHHTPQSRHTCLIFFTSTTLRINTPVLKTFNTVFGQHPTNLVMVRQFCSSLVLTFIHICIVYIMFYHFYTDTFFQSLPCFKIMNPIREYYIIDYYT